MADDTNRYSVNPTTTATAYAGGDAFGAPTAGKKFSPDGVNGARVTHIDASLKGTVAVPLDVMVYANTLTTPVLDNAAFVLAAADQTALKLIGRFTIAVADWKAVQGATGGLFTVHKDIPQIFVGGGGDYTVALVVDTTGPFTPTVANGLVLTFVAENALDAGLN